MEKHGGYYILILFLRRNTKICIGRLGNVEFKKGYYLYAGSAKVNLTSRLQRHKIKKKRCFWHIDYLRERTDFCDAVIVRSKDSLECKIADTLKNISDWIIPKFGSSDCSCKSHLFGMHINPFKSSDFIKALEDIIW